MKTCKKMPNISEANFRSVISNKKIILIPLTITFLFSMGCKKFIDIEPPVTSTNANVVFNTDANAIAVLTNVYALLSDNRMSQFGPTSISVFSGLSSDELTLFDINSQNYKPYYSNSLTSQSGTGTFWTSIYPIVFISNAAIEELSKPSHLTESVKQQLLGEAKFVRAFCYFYLVNLYGDVPLALSTDPQVNSLLSRTSTTTVWDQIINDINEAKVLLSSKYLDATLINMTSERVRPTSAAASALLSRSLLFRGEWAKSEAEATLVLNNSNYSLDSLNGAFLKNSKEAIWQLQPVRSGSNANTAEGFVFVLNSTGPSTDNPVYLSNYAMSAFEINDERKINWTGSVTVGSNTFNYPLKYKIGAVTSVVKENSSVFRLAEQYLIRAEARAQQNNINAAISDLNVIRNRAGLTDYSGSIDKNSVLNAIYQERRVELFSEWGFRWFDLKRTGAINNVMSTVASSKGGTWVSYKQWYPIPLKEIEKDPNLEQNAGYQ